MRGHQKARLNMYNTVISYCNENAALIAAIPVLQSSLTLFATTVAEINVLMKQREMVILGIAEGKKVLREKLAAQAIVIGSKLFAYAVAIDDHEMKRIVDYSNSELLKVKDEELPAICGNMLDIANANYTPLQEYKVTTTLLDQFADTIAQFTGSIPRPRMAVSKRSGNLKRIGSLFQNADYILKNSMDKVIREYKLSHPVFYETYWSARVIIDPSTTVSRITGVVTNRRNGAPLSGVTITVSENDQITYSSVFGKFTLKDVPADTYTIVVSMEGFHTETVSDVVVNAGRITKMKVTLIPLVVQEVV